MVVETPTDMIARLTGFTPGPWKWDERQSGTYAGVEDVFWIEEYAGEAWLEFAQGCDEAEANAALIAAAPDLHRELDAALAREDTARDALIAATAALAGSASAYRRYAKRHKSRGIAETDALFSTRADDFDKAVKAARAALEVKP